MMAMMGRHRAQALGLGVLIASASLLGGTAIAADTVDVGGSAVAYDTSLVEDAESDSARRTTYYAADTLVAAAWDADADGNDDLWMQVDPDWYVERVAADRDGDGIAESVVTVDHDGKSTADAMPAASAEIPAPVEESSTGSPIVIIAIGAVLGAVVIASAVWLARRRKGRITAMLLVLSLAAVAVPADAADPLWDEDCNLDSARFDDEWEKYSDIDDERVESPSNDARQFSDAVEEAMALMLLAYELEMDLEMESQVIAALRDYRGELSRDQTRNLLRAFIRLTMLTGETIKGAVNLGSSIEKLGGTVLETIGASLKISDHYQLKQSDQKKTVRNAVNGVGWSVFKDVLESMGDPNSFVKTVATSSMEEANKLADLPEWKISDAEFQVLRDQHLTSKALDTVMLEAERDQADRRGLLESVEEELEFVLAEADTQRAAEKERVRALLIAQCEKERDEASTTTSSTVATATTTSTTTTTQSSNIIEIALADVGGPGVVQHDGRSLWNAQTDNVTRENVTDWSSSYHEASETVGGAIRLDLEAGTVTGRITETWTCAGDTDCAWSERTTSLVATLNAVMLPSGTGWDLEGEATIDYAVAGSRIETPSDCNGTECYHCAEGICRVEFSTTATAPVVGHVEGSFLTIEFMDQLAEDLFSMDFEPIRTTEFFMSRWLHQADLPVPVPSP
jgi:hypothetical protein